MPAVQACRLRHLARPTPARFPAPRRKSVDHQEHPMPTTTKIFQENTFTTVNQTWSGPGTATVEQDAFVLVQGADAFDFNNGSWNVTVNGTIESDAKGIVFSGAATRNSTLRIGT